MPLALGLSLGLLTIAIAVLVAFYLQRRRGKKSALLDARATPPAQGDQLSGALQESKSHPQLTRPPTHGSNRSSTATAVTITSLAIPESGMLPSHEPCEGGSMEKMSPSNV